MSPQLENGYTKIADEILDALIRFRIAGVEMQCLLFIIRKTYGYNKKSDWISNSQFVSATGLRKGHVSRAVKSLIVKNIVTKNDNKRVPSYQFNKKYTTWKKLPKKEPVTKKGTRVTKNGVHSKLPKMGDTTNNNLTKENVSTIFNFWNGKGIIKHRNLDKFEPHINAALFHYSVEEIKEAIQNYSEILLSDKHYFSYKWALEEFLNRKNGIDKFLSENNPQITFLKREHKEQQFPKINSVHQAKIVEDDNRARRILERKANEQLESADSSEPVRRIVN